MKLRYCLALLLAVTIFATNAHAQKKSEIKGIELGGMVGYQVLGWYYDLKFADNMNYSFFIAAPMQQNVKAEFSYTRQDTRLENRGRYYPNLSDFDASVEYFQIGGVGEMPKSEKVIPFGLFSLGATRFAQQNVGQGEINYADVWRFSITAGLGVKILASERFGLRLQARALMPIDFAGVGIFCGMGGCSGGVGGAIQFFQMDFSGGVFFRI